MWPAGLLRRNGVIGSAMAQPITMIFVSFGKKHVLSNDIEQIIKNSFLAKLYRKKQQNWKTQNFGGFSIRAVARSAGAWDPSLSLKMIRPLPLNYNVPATKNILLGSFSFLDFAAIYCLALFVRLNFFMNIHAIHFFIFDHSVIKNILIEI